MGNRSCIMPTCPLPEDTSGLNSRTTTKSRKKSNTRAIKLIRADGIVKIYHQPIKVSELVSEFPKHMVCNSDSFYIGQRIPALSHNDKLKHGNSYFVLPNHLFQSVLSVVSITSFLASSRKASDDKFKEALLKCQPFNIQKTPSGILRVNVSDEFISRLMDGHKDDEDNKCLLCTTKELEKDYAQLVGVKHYWKPKLETIKEKRDEKKKMKVKITIVSSTKRRSKNTIFVPKSRNLGHCSSSSSSSSSMTLSPKIVSTSKMERFLGKGKKSKQEYDF